MIVHILLINAQSLSAGDMQGLSETVQSLRQIPEIQSFSCGEDFSGRGNGYTYAAVMTFADRAALQRYSANEHHLKVVETLQRLAPDRLVVDYETGTSGIST